MENQNSERDHVVPSTPCSDCPPEETTCDCCEKPPTKTMNDKTSKWCANWFVGYYCDDCFAEVERIMKQTVEEKSVKAAIDPNAGQHPTAEAP